MTKTPQSPYAIGEPMVAWCESEGLDARNIPVHSFSFDPETMTVTYREFLRGPTGLKIVEAIVEDQATGTYLKGPVQTKAVATAPPMAVQS